ncbi:hypothetical protein [Paenibacillus sp. ISL-20]|uniref:hypothetical protein n=1 Tax=Paenibacillus sp. ISL-20 TaxID=2819163 RepID=UPI002035430C|nr:hypothetical protein [Paenibacillus sp. ISL-20]
MNHWIDKEPTATALMELHVQAMFTHDRDVRIRTSTSLGREMSLPPGFSWAER